MAEYRAIPQGYMTVGELAKKMNITVRTLQYYDKERILSPSAESEGGRRLYTVKDMVKLHQVMSLKALGFSLNDIRDKLSSLDDKYEVANTLALQAQMIEEKISELSNTLQTLKKLREEVLSMETVDFVRYADILINIEMENEHYGLVKYLDDQTLEFLHSRFDKASALKFMRKFNQLTSNVLLLDQKEIPPQSAKAQELAKNFWNLILDFTSGDMSLIPKLMEISTKINSDSNNKMTQINSYIEKALEFYLDGLIAEGGKK